MVRLPVFAHRFRVAQRIPEIMGFKWTKSGHFAWSGSGVIPIPSMRICTSPHYCKTIPKNLKGKGKSSQAWLTRHLNDPYVKKAQEMGYRARSAFKLIEMDQSLKILKPGMVVVECGAAPGAWTQVIVERINSTGKDTSKKQGRVVGIDLLPIVPLRGAIFIPGCDFTDEKVQAFTRALLRGLPNHDSMDGDGIYSPEDAGIQELLAGDIGGTQLVDLVVSDMAPNASGHGFTDHFRIVNLVKSALSFAVKNAKPGSSFLSKLWQGSEVSSLQRQLETFYESVKIVKPPSSRKDSSETFIFAKNKRKEIKFPCEDFTG